MLFNYFSQDFRRFKYQCWVIIITFDSNDFMHRISTTLIKIKYCLWYHIDLSNFSELHYFTSWWNPVLYVLLCVIYFWLCTNMYEWLFCFWLLFWKGGYCFSFLDIHGVKMDDSSKRNHSVSLIVVSNWLFLALISIIRSTQRSPVHEQCGAITALNLVTLCIDILWFVYNWTRIF